MFNLAKQASAPVQTSTTSAFGDTGDQKAASEKARPISSNPVAGTPWCVVWTGDRKV